MSTDPGSHRQLDGQEAADAAALAEAQRHVDCCYFTPTGPIGFIEGVYRGKSGHMRVRVMMAGGGNIRHADLDDIYIPVQGG